MNINKPTNIKCLFDKCGIEFRSMKLLISHLEIYHNKKIEVELMDFETIEGKVINYNLINN